QMRIDRIGGAFQFPQISKKIAENFLTVEERTIFMDKVQELKERKLLSEDENNYNLTEEGIFWGNNIAREVVTEILDKTLGKEKY
ncbi:MAG: radical SAM protein, partial [Fusobacteriaceae bacterium]